MSSAFQDHLPLDGFAQEPPSPSRRTRTPLPDGIPETLLFVAEESRSMEPVVREVYETIGRYANRDGLAWPSQDRIKTHLRRGKTGVVKAIRSLEYSGHLQVTQGHQNCPNRYQLMRPGTNERFISPRNGFRDHQDSSLVPDRTNQSFISPPQDWKVEREIIQILERLQYLLSLLPPEARDWFSRGLTDPSLVLVGTNNESQDHPLVPNPSFQDYQQSRELEVRRWLDEHWAWLQENTEWRHLKALQDHCLANPGEFTRFQAKYDADQEAAAAPVEESEYPLLPEEATADASAEALWADVLADLEGEVKTISFSTYIAGSSGHHLDQVNGILVVAFPTEHAARVVERRWYHSVERAVRRVTSRELDITFAVRSHAAA